MFPLFWDLELWNKFHPPPPYTHIPPYELSLTCHSNSNLAQNGHSLLHLKSYDHPNVRKG